MERLPLQCPLRLCPPCEELDSGSGGSTLVALDKAQAAGATAPPQSCPECPPPPPACPTLPPPPPHQLEQQQQSSSPDAGAAPAPAPSTGALCGGASAVPRVAEALAAARVALAESVEQAFAPWRDTGFTLEDIEATALELGAVGVHDTQMWIEVRARSPHSSSSSSRSRRTTAVAIGCAAGGQVLLRLSPLYSPHHPPTPTPHPPPTGAQRHHPLPPATRRHLRLVLQPLVRAAAGGAAARRGGWAPALPRAPAHDLERVRLLRLHSAGGGGGARRGGWGRRLGRACTQRPDRRGRRRRLANRPRCRTLARPPACTAHCALQGGASNRCKSPVFSIIRHRDHRDVLVPPFVPAYEPQWVPWDEKKDQAFFRCGALCNVLCCAQ